MWCFEGRAAHCTARVVCKSLGKKSGVWLGFIYCNFIDKVKDCVKVVSS